MYGPYNMVPIDKDLLYRIEYTDQTVQTWFLRLNKRDKHCSWYTSGLFKFCKRYESYHLANNGYSRDKKIHSESGYYRKHNSDETL